LEAELYIAVIGTGYVGLIAGTCLAELGCSVTCVDKDGDKIELLKEGKIPFYEPGLSDLIHKNLAADRLAFSTSISEAMSHSTVAFIAVGTEGLFDGQLSVAALHEVECEIAKAMGHYTVIVLTSTVPVGTASSLIDLIRKHQEHPVPFDVVSNPEFQREGTAVEDFMHPERIVLGTGSAKALEVMREMYRPLKTAGVPFIETSHETAEMVKITANSFLAIKISFINEISNLCDGLNCDVQVLSKALGLDSRIGSRFLAPGPGFGGSCFPKDS
jgi:UDPglucose 6-dehydrogenase